LFCYATFDLTSLALLKHWSWPVAIVDVSWGAFVTAVSSTAGLLVANWVARRADSSWVAKRSVPTTRDPDGGHASLAPSSNDASRHFGCGTIRM
jgi:hypothetical protein